VASRKPPRRRARPPAGERSPVRAAPDPPAVTWAASALQEDGLTGYWIVLSLADLLQLRKRLATFSLNAQRQVWGHLHRARAESAEEYAARLAEATK
jgi:hypothetical protein